MSPREDWEAVDRYFQGALVEEDDALVAARESAAANGLTPIEVTSNQGKLLALMVQMAGARQILEFGTFTAFSTIWLARAVGPEGRVTTLEVDPRTAEIAAENVARAGVADRVTIAVGPAAESAQRLIDDGAGPFDFVFIDADKKNQAVYLEMALALTRLGSVIVGDNVVRDGAVADAAGADENVQGIRASIDLLGSDPRLDATALQTVGAKGWDGFSVARVVDRSADSNP